MLKTHWLDYVQENTYTVNTCPGLCCPWSHGLRPKKLSVSVGVPPALVLAKGHAPSVASVMSIVNDMGDNEMIRGAVHRSPGICLTAEENPRKPQLGDV